MLECKNKSNIVLIKPKVAKIANNFVDMTDSMNRKGKNAGYQLFLLFPQYFDIITSDDINFHFHFLP